MTDNTFELITLCGSALVLDLICLAAIATLVNSLSGFFIYSGFFPNSIPNISGLCLNSNFHFTHIFSIKQKCGQWQHPNTTHDLKVLN